MTKLHRPTRRSGHHGQERTIGQVSGRVWSGQTGQIPIGMSGVRALVYALRVSGKRVENAQLRRGSRLMRSACGPAVVPTCHSLSSCSEVMSRIESAINEISVGREQIQSSDRLILYLMLGLYGRSAGDRCAGCDWRIAPDNRLFRNRAFGPGLGVSKSASEIGAGVCAGAWRLDPPLDF
jgi:hypothetical protein